jgi:hypothetical protein
MKRTALGIRMHSGWGVLVAVDEDAGIIDRRRLVVTNRDDPRGNQPYHYAEQLGLPKAEKYLADYTAETERLARQEIANAVSDLKSCGHQVNNAAILVASGRTLPPLAQILAAHPLIHTAEGKLFRDTTRRACESLSIPVMDIRERDLENCAKKTLAASATRVIGKLAQAGKSLGPPWTADHKSAALAAYLALKVKGLKLES